MSIVTRISEALARGSTRRRAVHTAAVASFANVAAVAAVGPRSPQGEQCVARLTYGETACNPPYGAYCNNTDYENNAANCDGATCANGCTLDDQYYPQEVQPACWCTSFEQVEGNKNARAYWKCCDCQCPTPIHGPYGDVPEYNGTYGCGCRERIEVEFKPVSKKKKRK